MPDLPPAGSAVHLLRWAGGALFGASLLFVGWRFLVPWGVPAAGPLAGPVTWNACLFTAFALHHSLFARLGLRDVIRRAVGPGLERTAYVIVASLLFGLVGAAWRPVPGVWWEAGEPARWGLRALQVVGVWLTLRSAAILDIRDLAGLPPARAEGERQAAAARGFTTRGPYGWVRHPIYLGWLLLVWPVGTMTGTRAAFALLSCLYLVVAIPFEERTLLAVDGSYETYRRQVRWRLIPFLY